MDKIRVTKECLGVFYHRDCPLCGLNTSLLSKDNRVYDKGNVFCRSCYEKGKSNKKVSPSDFYILFSQNHQGNKIQLFEEEKICENIPRLEIAHLYGEIGEEDDFYLDLFYDKKTDKLYFRTLIVADADPWSGWETFNYINFEQAVYLLNKNGIHILDGINESNWKDYFDFQY